MGKKAPPSSTSDPSTDSPFSPTHTHNHELPRMDPPPPYDAVTSSSPRSSISSSVRSVDHLDPDGTGMENAQPAERRVDDVERAGSGEVPTSQNGNGRKKCDMKKQGGGCLNHGENVNGCMNFGDGSDGCMNYESKDGCMNYRSTGGCLNYEVNGDWEGNEGCLNYRRGGGCLMSAD